MRSALIVLGVVALVFVVAGAVNHSLAFDIDYGVGAVRGVSTFWIMVVGAGIVFVTGLVAALLARASAASAQRKLEVELASTYERLRAAEGELMLAASSTSTPVTASHETVGAVESPASSPAEPSAVTVPVTDEPAADEDRTVALHRDEQDVTQPDSDDT